MPKKRRRTGAANGSTGIYCPQEIVYCPNTPEGWEQFWESYNRDIHSQYNIEFVLGKVEEALKSLASVFGLEDADGGAVEDELPKYAADPDVIAGEVRMARAELAILRGHLDNCQTEKAVCAAFMLGRTFERLAVRQTEDLAAIGRETQAGRTRGGKSRRVLKTDAEEQLCYDLIDEYTGPRVSPTEVTQRVSAELSKELNRAISARTIKRIWDKRDKA